MASPQIMSVDAPSWMNNPVPPFSFNQRMERLLRQYSMLSTCPERRVSAIIVGLTPHFYRIMSAGANGDLEGTLYTPLHVHKARCVHAEERAVINLPPDYRRYPIISFSSLAPCYNCAKTLFKAGTRLHIYLDLYDDNTGVNFFLDEGVPVYRFRRYLQAIDPNITPTFSWQNQKGRFWGETA